MYFKAFTSAFKIVSDRPLIDIESIGSSLTQVVTDVFSPFSRGTGQISVCQKSLLVSASYWSTSL